MWEVCWSEHSANVCRLLVLMTGEYTRLTRAQSSVSSFKLVDVPHHEVHELQDGSPSASQGLLVHLFSAHESRQGKERAHIRTTRSQAFYVLLVSEKAFIVVMEFVFFSGRKVSVRPLGAECQRPIVGSLVVSPEPRLGTSFL